MSKESNEMSRKGYQCRWVLAGILAVFGGFSSAHADDLVNPDDLNELYRHYFKKYETKDAALNEKYRALQTILSADEFSQLKTVQRDWVKFKEDLCDHHPYFGDNFAVSELDPSAKSIIYLCRAEVTEARLLELAYITSQETELAYTLYSYQKKAPQASLADQNVLWQAYANKNCQFLSTYLKENRTDCMERQRFYYSALQL